jgi:hypothetical protein
LGGTVEVREVTVLSGARKLAELAPAVAVAP